MKHATRFSLTYREQFVTINQALNNFKFLYLK